MKKILMSFFVIIGIGLASIVLMLQYRSTIETDEKTAEVAHPVTKETTQPVTNDAPKKIKLETEVKPEEPPLPCVVSNATVTAKVLPRRIENDPKIPKNRQVLLAHRRIAIAEGRQFPTRFCTTQTPTGRQTAPYVLISEKPIDRDVHAQAMSDGAKVAGFLPNNALLVEADEKALQNLAEDTAFIGAVEYEPMDKIQPNLLDGKEETVKVSISLMNARYLEAMRDFVNKNGGRTLKSAKNNKSFDAILPRKMVPDLAAKGEIRFLSASCP